MPAATQTTLALLLLLQQPGRSPYSTIELAACNERCQQAPVCAEQVLSCRPPRWSPRRKRFLRLETYAEGVRRYARIASVISEVAADTSGWSGSDEAIVRLLVSVAYHESGFRRDVHDGSTRGDCDYRVVGGVKELIAGSCRSHCLGQIFLMPKQRTARGYAPDDLVGLDRASTRRCVQTMADRLAGANRTCNAQQGTAGVHPACTIGMYGGVAFYAQDGRIRARVRSYEHLRHSETTLSPEASAALDGEP